MSLCMFKSSQWFIVDREYNIYLLSEGVIFHYAYDTMRVVFYIYTGPSANYKGMYI